MLKYYVNEEKRMVVAVLKLEETGRQFVGRAKCSPNDKFDTEIGKRIAHHRAIMSYKAAHIDRLLRYKKQCGETIEIIDRKIEKCRKRINDLKGNIKECM